MAGSITARQCKTNGTNFQLLYIVLPQTGFYGPEINAEIIVLLTGELSV